MNGASLDKRKISKKMRMLAIAVGKESAKNSYHSMAMNPQYRGDKFTWHGWVKSIAGIAASQFWMTQPDSVPIWKIKIGKQIASRTARYWMKKLAAKELEQERQ